jgi:hypothetical protein
MRIDRILAQLRFVGFEVERRWRRTIGVSWRICGVPYRDVADELGIAAQASPCAREAMRANGEAR